jgi:arginase family enzyme
MSPLDELAVLLKPAGGGLYLVSTGKAEQQALQRRFYDASGDDDVTAKYRASLARIADAKVVLLGIPSDVGAGFRRGANLGPQAIRLRALEADPRFPQWCAEHGVVDAGDVFVVPQLLDDELLAPHAKVRVQDALYPDVDAALRRALPVSPLSIAERAVALVLQVNPRAKIMMLGGDHSCAWPVVKAMHGAGKRFCIVQIDAHTDLLETRLGIPICFATWTWHANELVGRNKRVIQLGIRATRFPKTHWEGTLDVVQIWADAATKDPSRAVDDVVAAAKATGLPVYFSNDIDGTDAVDADATGTPEPDGLPVDVVRTLIGRLGAEVGLAGGDVVEVAPVLGKDGGKRTLEVAGLYLQDTLRELLR